MPGVVQNAANVPQPRRVFRLLRVVRIDCPDSQLESAARLPRSLWNHDVRIPQRPRPVPAQTPRVQPLTETPECDSVAV